MLLDTSNDHALAISYISYKVHVTVFPTWCKHVGCMYSSALSLSIGKLH